MAQYNRVNLKNKIDATIFQNTSQQITADDVNEILTDISDSGYNILSDQSLYGLAEYDPTRNYELGKCVVYQGLIYQAIQTTSTGTFQNSEWAQLTFQALNGLTIFNDVDGEKLVLGGDLVFDTTIDGNGEFNLKLNNTNLEITNTSIKATNESSSCLVLSQIMNQEVLDSSTNTILISDNQNEPYKSENSIITTKITGGAPNNYIVDSIVQLREMSLSPDTGNNENIDIENSIVTMNGLRGANGISYGDLYITNSLFRTENSKNFTNKLNVDTSIIHTSDFLMTSGGDVNNSILLGKIIQDNGLPGLPNLIDSSIIINEGQSNLLAADGLSIRRSLILGENWAIAGENYYIWNSILSGSANTINSAGTGGGLANSIILGSNNVINSEHEHNNIGIIGATNISVGDFGEQNSQLFAGMNGNQTIVDGGYYVDNSLNTSALVIHQNENGTVNGYLAAPIEPGSVTTNKYFGKVSLASHDVTVTAPVEPNDIVILTLEDNRNSGSNTCWVSNITSGTFTINVQHFSIDDLVWVHWMIVKNNLTLA